MTALSNSGGYRPDIDGLRAISILVVVLYHAGVPGFGAGYLGVDSFFVISGFLITGQLLREAASTGAIGMARFYARRVRRLVPAFVTMALGTSLLAIVFLHPITEQRLFGNALVRSAAFYYNIALWRGGYAYDDRPAQEQMLLHTWSLGVEEQFYLVWPWVCLAVLRSGRPVAAFLGLVLLGLGGAWWMIPRDADAVFFLFPFRAWELGLGALVAARPRPAIRRKGGAVTLIGVILLLFALLSDKAPTSGVCTQLLVALGTALVAASGDVPSRFSSVLAARPLVYLGRISYSWYLWHWPLLVLARLAAIPEDGGIQLTSLGGGFVLATLTHHWVEEPARRIVIARPLGTLAWGFAGLAIVGFTGLAIERRSEWLAGQPEIASRLARLQRIPSRPCERAVETMGCSLAATPEPKGPFLFLWGDSFARSLSPALSEYAENRSSAVRLIAQPGCAPLMSPVPSGRTFPRHADQTCVGSLRSVERELRSRPSQVSGVVLAGRWALYVRGAGPTATLSSGLGATLDLLESLGARVLVVGAPPEFPFDVPTCLWRASGRCFVERSWNAAVRAQAREEIINAIRGRTSVRYADLFESLCPFSQCSGGTLDEPLMTDRTHLSVGAARELVLPILTRDLDWLRGAEDRTALTARPRPAVAK